MKKKLIKFIDNCKLPTSVGNFQIYAFKEIKTKKIHLAITFGKLIKNKPVLSRIHSQCLTGESFFSSRCDCRFQLTKSLKKIKKNGSGIIFYLKQEGRGIDLQNKIKAYKLQDNGYDTVEANLKLGFKKDGRDYKIAGSIAKFFEIKSVNLMTNNPNKIKSLESSGIKVNKRISIKDKSNRYNKKYLETKKNKLDHLI